MNYKVTFTETYGGWTSFDRFPYIPTVGQHVNVVGENGTRITGQVTKVTGLYDATKRSVFGVDPPEFEVKVKFESTEAYNNW